MFPVPTHVALARLSSSGRLVLLSIPFVLAIATMLATKHTAAPACQSYKHKSGGASLCKRINSFSRTRGRESACVNVHFRPGAEA
jgi:hypothetical protein